MTLVLWSGAALIAYIVKGFTGFGPALVVVPVLSALYSPTTALATSAMVDAAVGAVFLAYLRLNALQLKMLGRMSGSLVAGTIVGSLSVNYVPHDALLVLVCVPVIGLAVQLLRTGKPGIARPGTQLPLQLSCFLAGLSGGLVGVSGPFIVAGTARFDKSEMRRLLVAVFLVEGIVRIVTYAATGVITAQSVQLGGIAVPTVAAGLIIGNWLHARVSQRRFTVVVAWFLIAVAIQPLVSAFI
jgi:uncharacterized membrane protein YfcA